MLLAVRHGLTSDFSAAVLMQAVTASPHSLNPFPGAAVAQGQENAVGRWDGDGFLRCEHCRDPLPAA